jgi:hypothetical protein
VQTASPGMLLALKTVACRPKDMDDIYILMRKLGIKDYHGLSLNLEKYFGKRIFEAQGTPSNYIHIGASIKKILNNAPDDLRPPKPKPLFTRLFGSDSDSSKTPKHTTEQCGVYKIKKIDGIVQSSKQCRRQSNHGGKHRFYGPVAKR